VVEQVSCNRYKRREGCEAPDNIVLARRFEKLFPLPELIFCLTPLAMAPDAYRASDTDGADHDPG
jgi:hypothetical protein